MQIIAIYSPKNKPTEYELKHVNPTCGFIFRKAGQLPKQAKKILLHVGENVLTSEDFELLRTDKQAHKMLAEGTLKLVTRTESSLVQFSTPPLSGGVEANLEQASLDA